MTEVRDAPSPEFSYQGPAADELVMCGPGLHVAFARANGLVHSLRLPGHASPEAGETIRPGQDLVTVAPVPVTAWSRLTPLVSSIPSTRNWSGTSCPKTAVRASVCY